MAYLIIYSIDLICNQSTKMIYDKLKIILEMKDIKFSDKKSIKKKNTIK